MIQPQRSTFLFDNDAMEYVLGESSSAMNLSKGRIEFVEILQDSVAKELLAVIPPLS